MARTRGSSERIYRHKNDMDSINASAVDKEGNVTWYRSGNTKTGDYFVNTEEDFNKMIKNYEYTLDTKISKEERKAVAEELKEAVT